MISKLKNIHRLLGKNTKKPDMLLLYVADEVDERYNKLIVSAAGVGENL